MQLPGGKSIPGAVQLVRIPEPLENIASETHDQCAAMDFHIRTTSKNVSTCRNLAGALAAYPPDMRPKVDAQRRLLIPLGPMNGWEELQDYVTRAPNDDPDHFSPARIKAKVRFTRTADNADFVARRPGRSPNPEDAGMKMWLTVPGPTGKSHGYRCRRQT